MAKISVNNEYLVNGILKVRRYKNEEGEIIVEGSFACHYYFEEITSLNSYRYFVSGIEVVEEVFGADDYDIVYNFIAEDINNKFGMSHLSPEEVEIIEGGIYGKEGYVRGTVLEGGAQDDNEE